jgi:hypothetical protein
MGLEKGSRTMWWRICILVLLIVIASVSSHKNIQDEREAVLPAYQDTPEARLDFEEYLTWIEIGWMVLPCVAFAIYVVGLAASRAPSTNFRSAFAYLALTALNYGQYAFNGPSNPNTAGHLHLLLVPFLWGGLVGGVLSLFMVRRLIKTPRSIPGKDRI